MENQEEFEKEKRLIAQEIADGFGLPVTRGVIASLEGSFKIEFGNVVITVEYPPFVPRDDIASFVKSIASFPEIFAQFGMDMTDANDDFDKLLLTLKIITSLFVARTGASDAEINIAVSDDGLDGIQDIKEEE